jgi:alkanesulfonate monooxygenase SsuD/methylene tetrahydromethanopterin reductase-like flavin-dependent oxidoreductase (luciferase family)
MEESRGRFDEAVPMILNALETGVMEAHDGQYFKQPRADIRPRPTTSFKGRTMQVAMSGESIIEAAKLGLKMLQFSYKPIEAHREEVKTYARVFREHHKSPPPIPFFVDFLVCDENSDRVAENANKYVRTYLLSLMRHYEMMSDHFSKAKGYEEYGQNAQALAAAGLDAVADGYLAGQTWGTPQQILDKINARRAGVGDYDAMFVTRFAGTPYDVVERTMRTFAAKVMPELKSWNISGSMAA